MDEVWKPIPGYGDHFEASSFGRIKRKQRVVEKFCGLSNSMVKQVYEELILRASPGPYGHLRCRVGVDNKRLNLSVHQAVLLAFVGPCPDGLEGCHNDGNAGNNRPGNLRWDTHAANNADRKKHGRYAVGEKHHAASITIEQARAIKAADSHLSAAKMAGVTYKLAWRIRKGETWADAL